MSDPLILVTCFQPFGGSSRNASQEAVRLLPDRIASCRIERQLLPVLWDRAPIRLEELLDRLHPAALLAVGQAGPEPELRIERLGINLACGTDSAGVTRSETPLVPQGPAAYFSTFPWASMLRRLTAEGIPARCSFHAGTYLCNCILYLALHLAAARFPRLQAGFLHVPSLPEEGPYGLFSPERTAYALSVCLEEIAGSLLSPAADPAAKL